MLFNSREFLALLALTFGVYYLPGLRRYQTAILILASFIFYAWEAPWLLLLLIGSVLVNSWLSYIISLTTPARLRALLTLGVGLNLLVIVFFKYSPLLSTLIPPNAKPEGWRILLTLPLPIGISFYTFENISLLVDLFRGRTHGKLPFTASTFGQHLTQTTLFLAFFPHLISGPILKAEDFYPQIKLKLLRDVDFARAFRLCVVGAFLKISIADHLKDTTYLLDYPNFVPFNSMTLVALLFGYSLQIFADFAGYSLIAVGVALLFGYHLPMNFAYPYLADSLANFWRRWHISLSNWLREYLYYPLGGNRRGAFRTYLNLFVVMTLGGLWHGAAWSFAIWGLFHGLGLASERWVADRFPNAHQLLPSPVKVLLVFGFVTAGWLFFKLPNFEHVVVFMRTLSLNWHHGFGGQKRALVNITLLSIPVILFHWVGVSHRFRNWVARYESLAYGTLIAGIIVGHGLPGRFIYFQF